MGIMLETASERLSAKGGPHWASPDKEPARRLETIELAGELRIPFTSGILIGIGETRAERVEALEALRELHERHGHLQEVIVQNFRAKPGTRMASHPEPSLDDHLWTIAAARLLLPADVAVQAPPNLAYDDFPRLLDAGIDDWGGVSPVTIDHVNPEAPWPDRDRLAAATRSRGLELAPRLPVYPAVPLRRAGSTRRCCRRRCARPTRSGSPARTAGTRARPAASRSSSRATRCRWTTADELGEEELVRLFRARGEERQRVFAAADRLRREVCGDEVSYVVTRNIQYTNVCYFRCGFCAFSKGKLAANLRGAPYLVPHEEIVRRCARGVGPRRHRGVPPGRHPPGVHRRVLRIRRRRDQERAAGAAHPRVLGARGLAGRGDARAAARGLPRVLRDLGLGSLPGTAAEILDDEVRAIICPDKVSTAQWLAVHEAAHRVGLRSNVTIMFGHVEQPQHWARHLLRAREQQEKSGGFTEFVPLPFVHMEAPMWLQGRARSGPTFGESLLLHAVARLALHPAITNIQASWVKLGPEGVAAALRAGVNDLGGTLMNESISRSAGSEHGQEMPPETMEALIRANGRAPRQRTTLYADAPAERRAASFAAAPLAEPLNPPVRDAGLKAPPRLVRPGLLARAR